MLLRNMVSFIFSCQLLDIFLSLVSTYTPHKYTMPCVPPTKMCHIPKLKIGITTGISAKERALTINLLAKPGTKPDDFVRPGHIFPLRARDNGVLTRDGHTEAAVDLSRLAGSSPVGVLCEIVSEEDPVHMARLPELKRFCKKHGFVLTSIADLAQYRRDTGL
mmetsp:Transcript_12221/g.18265  ORF Transcript_12221/g.18265 Transcript_12221/m.18265 type:complete len:163 (-) Transcript_12221:759-1247(-)